MTNFTNLSLQDELKCVMILLLVKIYERSVECKNEIRFYIYY